MTTAMLPVARLWNETHPQARVRDYISYSALKTYSSCPLRYYFRYLVGLPEEFVASNLLFGTGVHAAVEFHFNELLAGNAPPDLDTLLDVFWAAWSQEANRPIRFGSGETIDTIGALADRMLRTFMASELARPAGKILAVEEELRSPIIPGMPDLLGRIDLVIDEGDAIKLVDFKTARAAWNEDNVVESSGQLLLYSELISSMADGRPIKSAFAVLTKTKTPTAAMHPVQIDRREVDRAKHIAERIWHAIEARSIYPNPSPMNCATCPFKEPCRAWNG